MLEGLTQKNAAPVEGTSAAVAAVDGQIEALMRVIGVSDGETAGKAGTERTAA